MFDMFDGFRWFGLILSDLSGKDATQLCEMANLGLPVPPGFCLTDYGRVATWPDAKMALSHLETFLQKGFGGRQPQPLLMTLRGGSQEVTGLGLTDDIAERMSMQENANCVWDSYRRLLTSYAQVHEPPGHIALMFYSEGTSERVCCLHFDDRHNCTTRTFFTLEKRTQLLYIIHYNSTSLRIVAVAAAGGVRSGSVALR